MGRPVDLSRGALTVAEVAAAGVAAIFVPLPHAVDDHQTKNAQALVDKHAAYLLPQAQLERGGLADILSTIFAAPAKLVDMGRQAHQLARLDACERVAEVCIELAEQHA